MIEKEEAIKKGFLQNKKVRLKPILKSGKMIKDPKHIGYFMFDGAFKNYPLPRNPKTGAYKPILNDEELEYFNQVLRSDLSFNKKEDNFWEKYTVRVTKDENLLKYGIEFDLSDPWSNLDYRIMKALKITAPSYAVRFSNPKYKWYLAEENEELIIEAKEAEKTEEIFTFFGTIKGSKNSLIDLLSVYYAEKSRSNTVDITATLEFFQSEVRKIIKNDPNFIYECMMDNDYKIKALITNAVRAGAINKSGRNKYNLLGESSNYDYIGLTKRLSRLKEETDDMYLQIVEQIDQFNKDNKIN